MIQIRLSDSSDWVEVKPTIFPDGTSQIWKLPEEFSKPKEMYGNPMRMVIHIKWNFEFEAELIHVNQLYDLLSPNFNLTLYIPYLPYARQDKKISNTTTFALHTFLEILNANKYPWGIEVFDMHNTYFSSYNHRIKNIEPKKEILQAIHQFSPDYLFFPDKGAFTRYSNMFNDEPTAFSMLPKIYGEKVRDQLTGNITAYEVKTFSEIKLGSNILIVDDICDGGATFISAIKELKKLGCADVGLYVSHGVFSKGKVPLYDAGFTRIYTTNSLIKNKDGFEV